MNPYHLTVDILILMLCLLCVKCQVYSWTNQPSDFYIQPCSTDPLQFNWTYSPPTPNPLGIEWSKRNAGGTFDSIATFGGGTFSPSDARLTRGSTAEIALSNPTPADAGTYRVSVTDAGGLNIESTVIVSDVTTATLESSGITATCTDNTVTCGGVTDLGSPAATITLSYGSTSKTNTGLTVTSDLLSTQETVTCTISGPATVCLDSSKTSASVQCGLTTTPTPTTTPSPTTPTPGGCDWIIIIIVIAVLFLVAAIVAILLMGKRMCGAKKKFEEKKSELKARPEKDITEKELEALENLRKNYAKTEHDFWITYVVCGSVCCLLGLIFIIVILLKCPPVCSPTDVHLIVWILTAVNIILSVVCIAVLACKRKSNDLEALEKKFHLGFGCACCVVVIIFIIVILAVCPPGNDKGIGGIAASGICLLFGIFPLIFGLYKLCDCCSNREDQSKDKENAPVKDKKKEDAKKKNKKEEKKKNEGEETQKNKGEEIAMESDKLGASTVPTSELPPPKSVLQQKEGGSELKELRTAHRGILPSPRARVSPENSNHSLASSSGVDPNMPQ